MKVPFTKASACGNDFLIVDGAAAPSDLHDSASALAIATRHWRGWRGMALSCGGCRHASSPDHCDGSEAEISAMGRAVSPRYLVSRGHSGKIAISTGAGVKHCELVSGKP